MMIGIITFSAKLSFPMLELIQIGAAFLGRGFSVNHQKTINTFVSSSAQFRSLRTDSGISHLSVHYELCLEAQTYYPGD